MGFFEDIKDSFAQQRIENNGLPYASGWQKCDDCRYRMYKNNHYVCYVRQMTVGANQVCNNFASGDPIYRLK